MTKSKRKCIFCGEPNKLTREHIWPAWFARLLLDLGHDEYFVRGPNGVIFSTNKAEVTTKKVCKPCNSGWMSDIEAAAIPRATPLVQGIPGFISASDQTILARWAVLKAMLLVSSDAGGQRAIERAEFDRFRHEQTPNLSNTAVWIGAYAGTDDAFWSQVMYPPTLFGRREPGYFTTMLFHRLIVQVMQLFGPVDVHELHVAPRGMDLISTYSSHAVYWPRSNRQFDLREMIAIARRPNNRFSPELIRLLD